MEIVTAYRASDGTLFETEQACLDHEAPLRLQAEVSEFANSAAYPYANDPRRVPMALKIIVAWERFKERKALLAALPDDEDTDTSPGTPAPEVVGSPAPFAAPENAPPPPLEPCVPGR